MFFIDLDTDFLTRYDMAKFMEFVGSGSSGSGSAGSECFDPMNSYLISKIKSLPIGGWRVVQSDEYRPELMSYRIYGHTQYWWILLLYNDILTVDDLTSDKTIMYPLLDDLETIYFQLNALALGRMS